MLARFARSGSQSRPPLKILDPPMDTLDLVYSGPTTGMWARSKNSLRSWTSRTETHDELHLNAIWQKMKLDTTNTGTPVQSTAWLFTKQRWIKLEYSIKCLERITIYYKFCIFTCFSGIALKRLICLVFLVCNIFICVIEYAHSDCFYWTF